MKLNKEQVHALQAVPMYAYRHAPIPDGSHDIRTVTYANVPEVAWGGDDVLHLVISHGAWGGPTSFGPIARTALRAAGAAGRPATATLYSDPLMGFGSYAKAHRQERYARVVDVRSARLERPVHTAGHSWNALGSLEVAEQAYKLGQVASWTGYTPANRLAPGDITLGQFLKGGCKEIGRGKSLAGLGSLVAAGAVVSGLLMHALPAPRLARAEAVSALNTRFSNELIAAQNTLPTGLALAGRDAFFGYGDVAAEHLRGAGFEGAIGVMEGMTHIGSAANFRRGGIALFSVVNAVLSPAEPGNSAYYPSETSAGQPATGWGRLA